MLHRTILLTIFLILAACSNQHLVATNFNDVLYTGMTRLEYDLQWHNPTYDAVRGNLQVDKSNYFFDSDNWEVLVYSIYRFDSTGSDKPRYSHKEFVAFRNGYLEEWGKGELPHYLKQKQVAR